MRETRAVVSAAGDCRALGARHALLNRIQLHESRTKTMNQFHYIRFSLPVISLLSIILAFPTYATETRVLNLQSPVRSIALSPNGKTLVCGTADNRVSIWDVSTGN